MRFGRKLRYLTHAEGLIHNEEMLYNADFFARLRTAGLVHMGMITGRFVQEVNSVLERMIAYSSEPWWDVVVCADLYKKPDPQALRFAINAVGTEGGLYIRLYSDCGILRKLPRKEKVDADEICRGQPKRTQVLGSHESDGRRVSAVIACI